MQKLRIIPQDRTIYSGNTYIGYIDEDDDVYVIVKGEAQKIGSSDDLREVLVLVRAWMNT